MYKKKKTEWGFTMVELLMVMAIVSLMVLIPVKMLTHGDQRTMLRQHVREVVAELYRIRNVAATMNRPYRLSIDNNEDNPDFYSMTVEFLDLATNTWTEDGSKPKIDLNKKYLQTITDEGATATFPLLFPFNSSGIQLDQTTDTPVLTARTVDFSNNKVKGDTISITLKSLGGIDVSDIY